MIKVPVNLITATANPNPHGAIKKKEKKRGKSKYYCSEVKLVIQDR